MVDLFKIEANVDPKKMRFIYGGKIIHPESKISETGLCHFGLITVYERGALLGG